MTGGLKAQELHSLFVRSANVGIMLQANLRRAIYIVVDEVSEKQQVFRKVNYINFYYKYIRHIGICFR
jgi:hypothetical protein